jgi:hypothetical protein
MIKTRILALFILIICIAFLSGCGAGLDEKNHAGGVQVALESTENRCSGEFYHPLTFPGEQVTQIKSVGDNFILIDRVISSDYDYYLDHPSFIGIKHIISFIETAQFKEYSGGELRFTARGGSDTGNYEFPYLLYYNPNTEELRREDLFLTLNQQEDIVFGKNGWKQILSNIEIQDTAAIFEFKPAAGEVLAGGRRLPCTTIRYDEQSNDLMFSFLNVELADNLIDKTIHESPGLKYVKEIRIEQLTGRPGVNQNTPQLPMVSARIALAGKPLYNAAASHTEGSINEGTDICTVRFK